MVCPKSTPIFEFGSAFPAETDIKLLQQPACLNSGEYSGIDF
jgi:hypothetical protein